MNWKTVLVVVVAISAGVATLFSIALRTPTPPVQELFVNGQVLTMTPDNRIVQAIALRDGRIEAVGSTEEILALADDEAIVNDLRGRTLMPGFIDAHGHFPGSGLAVVSADVTSPPVGTHTTMAEVMATMKAQADKTEPGQWVNGFGYDDTLLAEAMVRHGDLDVSVEDMQAIIVDDEANRLY